MDDEFIQYCKLNDIEDVEKLAKEIFQDAFTRLKYGEVPQVDISKIIVREPLMIKENKSQPEPVKEDIEERKPKNKDLLKTGNKDIYEE